MNGCWKYNSLYTKLEKNEGAINWNEGMTALEDVHLNCPWSAIYDMTNRGIYISVHNNYEDIAFVDMEDFEFQIYVDISEVSLLNNEARIINFPNPFSSFTTIQYFINEDSQINITIYDSMGKIVKVLVNEEKQKGTYSITWDTRKDSGKPANAALYYCRYRCGSFTQTIPLFVIE